MNVAMHHDQINGEVLYTLKLYSSSMHLGRLYFFPSRCIQSIIDRRVQYVSCFLLACFA